MLIELWLEKITYSCNINNKLYINLFKLVTLGPMGDKTIYFMVEPNRTMEICFTKHFLNCGEGSLKYTLKFHGSQPTSNIHFVKLLLKSIIYCFFLRTLLKISTN